MVQFQVNVGMGSFQPFVEALGKKHGAMLASRATQRHHQMTEMTFLVVGYALVYYVFHVFKKLMYCRSCVQIINDFPVAASLGFELGFTTWIGQGAAVEHEATAVAAEIVRIAFSEREAVYRDDEFGVESLEFGVDS